MIEWKPIESTKRLCKGDFVLYTSEYQSFFAKVNFVCHEINYLVISPHKHPNIGIVVHDLSYIKTPHETLQERVQQVQEGSTRP